MVDTSKLDSAASKIKSLAGDYEAEYKKLFSVVQKMKSSWDGKDNVAYTTQIAEKQTRDTAGVAVITLKKNQHIEWVKPAGELELANPHRYRVRSLPAAGALVREEDVAEQLQLGQ